MNTFIDITEEQKQDYNKVVFHSLQSYEWGEFRKKTGTKVIRRAKIEKDKIINGFTLTIHKIPFFPYNIGYLPKGNMPTNEILEELYRIGKQEKCVYIQLEPNVSRITNNESLITNLVHNSSFIIHNSFHPLFTKFTFILDLIKSEDELLKNMHPKTRYNIKVAQKHGIEIVEDNSDEAFETYLRLTKETTKRQEFYAHDENYHRKMWETLKPKTMNHELITNNQLTAHLFIGRYQSQTLVAWILFVFKDTLYYPYGASSSEFREVMASNLMMWEAIKFGKKLGLRQFDMWGALGPNPDIHDPWYGFHRFKEGYGPQLVEFVGSYDLVINSSLYQMTKLADKARWVFLKYKKYL